MAADLARARARINRAKRPYQPTLAAYFRLPTVQQPSTSINTGDDDSASPYRTRPGEWRLANLDASVQASLLNVGMRVRKAVSGGYQKQKQHDHAAQLGYTGDKENSSSGSSGSICLPSSHINEHGPEPAVWKKRALEDIEEEDVFLPLKTPLNSTPISNQADTASQLMETSQSARKIAQPASRLWQRQRLPSQTGNALPEPTSTTPIAMDIDFGEADFLRPREEIESDASDAAMDVG